MLEGIVHLVADTRLVVGRESPHSRYDVAFATFEADDVFDQRDSSGWLRVGTVRFRAGGAHR